MAASDSYPLIAALLVIALTIALVMWTRVYRSHHRTPSNELPVRQVHLDPQPETSERQSLWNTLSRREEEIARLAAEDSSDDEIARKLHLSVRTVQNHLQHAREKLHIHSRHEFKYFLQHIGDEFTAAPK